MAGKFLKEAKSARNDEFYTQYSDIEKEMNAYLEYDPNVFRDKSIFLPCDDPEWSNFTKYFAQNFNNFGLKKLISTSYAVESKNYKIDYQPTLFETETAKYDVNKTRIKGKIFILERNRKNKININDLKWDYLEGDGDFRSNEIMKLRDQSDIIITNPPFSLFREFLAWIFDANKLFLIIGNVNAITYKEVFPLIKDIKVWLGPSITSGDREFEIPASIVDKDKFTGEIRKNEKGKNIYYQRVVGVRWFTNLDHGRRHEPLPLMTMADNIKFSKHKEIRGKEYQKYHNYDAIEVPYVDAIPSDYKGAMGVPNSILDKYNPDQFEIIGSNLTVGTPMSEVAKKGTYDPGGPSFYLANKGNTFRRIYTRIIIKNKGVLK